VIRAITDQSPPTSLIARILNDRGDAEATTLSYVRLRAADSMLSVYFLSFPISEDDRLVDKTEE